MKQSGDDDKFSNPSKPQVSSFLQFVRALILYGFLIPISLYVSKFYKQYRITRTLKCMMKKHVCQMKEAR
jgi:hypothetical protein